MPKQQRSAFSSEVETGSREETASKQKSRARFFNSTKTEMAPEKALAAIDANTRTVQIACA